MRFGCVLSIVTQSLIILFSLYTIIPFRVIHCTKDTRPKRHPCCSISTLTIKGKVYSDFSTDSQNAKLSGNITQTT